MSLIMGQTGSVTDTHGSRDAAQQESIREKKPPDEPAVFVAAPVDTTVPPGQPRAGADQAAGVSPSPSLAASDTPPAGRAMLATAGLSSPCVIGVTPFGSFRSDR